MKQIKTLMVAALTLVMGVMMTSCLNSDGGESLYDWAGIVRVYSSMGNPYFVDSAGNKLFPTTLSVSAIEQAGVKFSDSKIALVYVKLVEDTENGATGLATEGTTPQSYDVELVGAQTLDGEPVVTAYSQEAMDEQAPETSPVGTLSFFDNWGGVMDAYLFDLDMLMVPIQFYLTNDTEKFKLHKLYLACNMEEVMEGSTELVFYLRHDRGSDEGASVPYSQWYGYDISSAVRQFAAKAGANPTKIVIKAHEAPATTTIPETYKTYEVEYKLSTQN